MGKETCRLAAPLFEFAPLPAVTVKGKVQPVQAKAEPGQLRCIKGMSSPLVGQEKEMGNTVDA